MTSTFAGAAGLRLAGERFPADRERGLVILLHGGGQTRHAWVSTAKALAGSGWSSIALDARGHGDSGWAADGDYSMDAFVADLVAVVERTDVVPVFVGASLGGLTALLAVGESHLRARGLVLVDVAPRLERAGVERITAFMTASPDGFGSLEEAAASVAAYNPHRRRPPNLEHLERNLRRAQDGRWRWHWDPAFMTIPDEPARALRHRRFVAAAEDVRVPTLLVRGERSEVVSAAGAQELLRIIPAAAEVVIPAAGHMVAGDDNAVFSRTLLSYLEQLEEQ
jgi:pimeloyl-ACP methyl ester carboxylesterase